MLRTRSVFLTAIAACAGGDKDGSDDSIATDDSVASADDDLDGVTFDEDCDDHDATVYPGAPELCDDVDNDCDSVVDEGLDETWYEDLDADGFGNATSTQVDCSTPDGFVPVSGDCDDTNAAAHPGAAEICNGADDDCDLLVDLEDDDLIAEPVDDCDDGVDDDCNGVVDDCGVVEGLEDADLIVTGDASNRHCGFDAEGVGDMDGDGTPDLAVSSVSYETWETVFDGTVAIVSGPATGTWVASEIASANLIGYSKDRDLNSNFGASLAGRVDENGDGAVDLLVGAPATYTKFPGEGTSNLFLGPLSGDIDAASADATFTAAYSSDTLGRGVMLLSDWNGDDYGDVVLAADFCEAAKGWGCVYVFEGPVSGTMSVTSAGHTFVDDTGFGAAFINRNNNPIGDLDGDGTEDLAIGDDTPDGGRIYIFLGGGLPSGTHDVDADSDTYAAAEERGDEFGCATARDADYDGDGYQDLVVGAYGFDRYRGAAYVLHGPIPADPWSATDYYARWEGHARSDEAGIAIASGSFDTDAGDDLLIGAVGKTATFEDSGGAYVALGPDSGTFLLATDSFRFFAGLEADSRTGWGGVDFIEDWDGDGRDEITVGGPFYDAGLTDAGALWLVGTERVPAE